MSSAPIVVWLRRDFRLRDHPALFHAAQSGAPVVPLFVRDETVDALGAAPKWRLGLALRHFARRLREVDSRLILRSGSAAEVVPAVVRETGAAEVCATCEDTPAANARDAQAEKSLRDTGVRFHNFPGRILLARPDAIRAGSGGPYRVFTPFWKALRLADIPRSLPPVRSLPAPSAWPRSENMDDWKTDAGMNHGAAVVFPRLRVGEESALLRLREFLAKRAGEYGERRDFPASDGVSGLSENLAWGEISPRVVWEAARDVAGADSFLRQLAWREFAYQLLFHFPDMAEENWRREWDSFPWRGDNEDAERWRRGATGVAMVDAPLREMYATGIMHNRGRMIAASFLCKHLLTHWRTGLAWFAECLADWDPANNALGWQWTAGCGPDAAPYFRIFNPESQAERFDADGAYQRRFVAEISGGAAAGAEALDYFRAIPKSWGMSPDDSYPPPVVGLSEGRNRALAALAQWKKQNRPAPAGD